MDLWKKSKYCVPRMKINNYILIILLAVANLASAGNPSEANIFQPGQYDVIYGKEDAPIQVLEYFALTCPHCSYFYENNFPSLKKEYIDTGKVRWIKRSFSSDQQSLKGTMLLSCIKKDRRESYLKILLSKQSNWAYQQDFIEILSNIASLGGMSKQDFNKCMNDASLEKSIRESDKKAKDDLDMKGTPSFYVNKKIVEVYSNDSFKNIFDELLDKRSK
jgi:protein-disulfide isomerase